MAEFASVLHRSAGIPALCFAKATGEINRVRQNCRAAYHEHAKQCGNDLKHSSLDPMFDHPRWLVDTVDSVGGLRAREPFGSLKL
jgi:hypothetical protein